MYFYIVFIVQIKLKKTYLFTTEYLLNIRKIPIVKKFKNSDNVYIYCSCFVYYLHQLTSK